MLPLAGRFGRAALTAFAFFAAGGGGVLAAAAVAAIFENWSCRVFHHAVGFRGASATVGGCGSFGFGCFRAAFFIGAGALSFRGAAGGIAKADGVAATIVDDFLHAFGAEA